MLGCGEGDVSAFQCPSSALTLELERSSNRCVELLCDLLVLSSHSSQLHQRYCDQPICPKWHQKISGLSSTNPFSEERDRATCFTIALSGMMANLVVTCLQEQSDHF